MKLINEEEFLKYKKSETLVIWGSGSSIKNLTPEDFDYLNQFDSISTTLFSKTKIKTTYYIIGEVLFNYYRAKNKKQMINNIPLDKLYEKSGESPLEYVKTFENYKDTCFIIWDDKWTNDKTHFEELDKLDNDYIWVKQYGHDPSLDLCKLEYDEATGPNNKFIDKKLYTKELLLNNKIWLHQWKGINGPIYFAKCMDYKKVIFVGVDLTAGLNSYAFDRNSFINNISSKIHKQHKNNGIHPCKDILFKFIQYLKNDIHFTTYTPSLLEEIIDVEKINKNVICTVLNDEYFIGGLVLLYSLKKHNMFNNDLIIFYSSLSPSSNLKLDNINFLKKYFNIKFIDVKRDIYLKYIKKYNKMFSAFICLESILCEKMINYDKVCFLDSDMLILNNLNFVFDKLNLSKLNGSSNDCPHFNFYRGNDHKCKINTGFMVYDTKIQSRLKKQILYFMKTFNGELPEWDQSIINNSLKNDFINNTDWFCNYKPGPTELKDNKWNIIHYTGKFKPWNCFQNRKNPVNRNETFDMYRHIIYKWFDYVKDFSKEIDDSDRSFIYKFLDNEKMRETWEEYKTL